ncbi:ankyrin repeat protein [Biomphalaria glabrata]|nr:putative ankyrin repeat protein [Biomphalaria glabrata]
MENQRGAFKKNERGRGRGGRGAKQSFKASNYRYFGFGPSGVLNGLVVQPSNRRQGYTSHIDRGRYSREAENIAESFPAAQASQSDAANKDRDLIEAAANGNVASFSAVLKQCVNCTSQNGLDLALLEATKRGYKSIVQQLIRAGARTCGLDEQGYTPLMIASEKGYLDIATALLKKSANVSAVSFNGQTSLHVALQPCGASDMLSLLLYHGADVNVGCGEGSTPLMRALELQDLDAIKILIDAGAKLDRYKNKRGETAWDVAKRLDLHQVLSFMNDEVHMSKKNYNKQSALMRAAASCNLEAFKLLLDCSYTEVNKTNKEGSTLMQIVKTLCRQTGNNRDSPGTSKRFEMIKLLLQNGAKADDCSTKEGNALILAVKSGQNELVQLLCMSQIKLNYLVNDKTALMIAAEKGHVDIVNTLLNAGADYKLKNSKQEDALLIAFKYGQVNCAKLLLQKRANLNVVKAAIVSIDNNRVSSLQYLLTHHELDVNTKCLLHRAIQQNNAAVVKLLIDKGADVNQLNDSMDSPLQLACNKDVSCVELLIKNGADVNLGHPLSGPPIIRAVPNVAKVLLQHGADVNKASASGETALMQACGCFGNTYDMVKLLLDAGADVNLMSDKGDTCLHYAVSTENIGNIKLLLEYGADVNAVTNSGDTPFLLAAEVGNVEILQLFLDKGAKVDVYDSQGCNALLRAIKMCDVSTEVVRLLAFDKEHLNKQSNRGYTPLMLAAEMVNYELMKTLLELGADVHVVNKEEPRKNDITALSILLDSSQIFKDSDIKCIEELLKYGAMSSLPKRCLSVFHKMIVLDKRRLVQLFVTHGMSPCNVDLQPISFRMGAFFEMQMLRYSMNAASPLSAALASGNSHIARYLAGNWFLTASDLTVFSQCSKLRDFLESISMQDCVDFLEEFTSQPLSLMKLSFVAASAAIGSPPGRQERIMQLPIPSVIKDKLLFKNEEVPMDYGTDASHNRLGFLDVGINMVDHVPDSPSGVFFDFDDPRQLMYDSDSDLCFSSVMYDDSDDTFMYI